MGKSVPQMKRDDPSTWVNLPELNIKPAGSGELDPYFYCKGGEYFPPFALSLVAPQRGAQKSLPVLNYGSCPGVWPHPSAWGSEPCLCLIILGHGRLSFGE